MAEYTYEQVLEASIAYFDGDDLAAKVFVDKYALQNNDGKYLELTPTDMHHRLAKEFARIEQKYPNPISEEEIFSLLDHYKYIVPQGSPMSAIGNDFKLQSLGNCFVVDASYDSYGGICKTDQELAQLMKRRAGVGVDLSHIRPHGAIANNAAKTSDGIAVFMERFSNTCREVAQKGRRGALIETISVEHPDIETFISIKHDLKKVTGANISVRLTDAFMQAVKDDQEFDLHWPIEAKAPIIKKTIKAKELWDKMINSAWLAAEPGYLFWDTIIKNSIPDLYANKHHNFKTQSSNPCFSGNTLIAVADGRNAVSIKQLADEGKDIPVYSVDINGQVSIKMGRHPRITGQDKKLVRVLLDDGGHFDVTPDHKCLLKDGTKILAKDLKKGDSLPRFTKELEPVKSGGKDYYRIYCNTLDNYKDKHYEHRLIAKFYKQTEWDNLYNTLKINGFTKTGGIVIHHKDYNSLNNSPDNLALMSFKDHCKLHGDIDTKGEKNGRFSGFSAEDIKECALQLTKQLGRRFSHQEWYKFAKSKGMPQEFSEFRLQQFGGNVLHLSKICASELKLEYSDLDPKIVKTYQSMLEQGYEAKIINREVIITRHCEECKNKFDVKHYQREQAYCSIPCASKALNANVIFKNKHQGGIHKYNVERSTNLKSQQAKVYSELKFALNRVPLMKEWEKACEMGGVSHRVGKVLKYGFKNFKEVKKAGDNYNHKVIDVIELEGKHLVYNITVDDNHTVALITGSRQLRNNTAYNGVYVFNCGEIPLGLDSCRLMAINLTSFVDKPFTNKAKFNFSMFQDYSSKAQRLMDDVVDLELEAMDKIISKIECDPEPLSIKQIELDVWKTFKQSCTQGRRTGLGITGLGDTLAMLNIKYGSSQSIEMTSEIYKTLAIGSHTASCKMAEERGAFPVFSYDIEKNHQYLNSIMNVCDPSIKKLWKTSGRRNIALTTTAPTGSVSTQTQTTSGIEPAYLLSYTRRKKINPSDKNAKIDFVDALGDKWQEFTVHHHGIKRWMDITGETDITKSPYWKATSNDVDWVASVDMQAGAQKWIDHAISKTCNLPKDATKELISEIYMRAFDAGCKGFTVYRDGCRDGVLIANEPAKNTSERPPAITEVLAPKRLDELPCDIKKVKIQGEQWTFFVGLLENKPYEVFGGLSKYVDIPNKCKTGIIRKNGKVDDITTYNLIIGSDDDEMVIKNLANVFENANYGAFTRTISLSLRHGIPIQYIVEQLVKDKYSDITSFSKVMSRVLKSYIKDGTQSSSEKTCPSCKKTNSLMYQEGCLLCPSCGYSRC